MKSLFLCFLFLFTLTSAQSINNDDLNSSPNVAPSMQPIASSPKPNANSPISYSSYPPGYENENENENENSPSESPSEFSSISTDSISSIGASGLSSSLMSTNTRNDESSSSIKKICDNTDYPDLCIATVAPFIRGNVVVNVQNVLQVAMKSSGRFAKLGFGAVKRASESPATSPNTKKMLKTCLDSWDTVSYNYEKAIEALRIHDTGRMTAVLSAAITDISDCEDAFEGVVSPLTGYDQKMTKMTSNCLAIVSQLPT